MQIAEPEPTAAPVSVLGPSLPLDLSWAASPPGTPSCAPPTPSWPGCTRTTRGSPRGSAVSGPMAPPASPSWRYWPTWGTHWRLEATKRCVGRPRGRWRASCPSSPWHRRPRRTVRRSCTGWASSGARPRTGSATSTSWARCGTRSNPGGKPRPSRRSRGPPTTSAASYGRGRGWAKLAAANKCETLQRQLPEIVERHRRGMALLLARAPCSAGASISTYRGAC